MTDAARIKAIIESHKAITKMAKCGDHVGAGLTVKICMGRETDENPLVSLEVSTLTQKLLDLLVQTQVDRLHDNLAFARADIGSLTEAVKLGEAYYVGITVKP